MEIKYYQGINKRSFMQDLYDFIVDGKTESFLAIFKTNCYIFHRNDLGKLVDVTFGANDSSIKEENIDQFIMEKLPTENNVMFCRYFPSLNQMIDVDFAILKTIQYRCNFTSSFTFPKTKHIDIASEINSKLKDKCIAKLKKIYPYETWGTQTSCYRNILSNYEAVNIYIEQDVQSLDDMDKCVEVLFSYSMYDIYKYLSDENAMQYLEQKYIPCEQTDQFDFEVGRFYNLLDKIKEIKNRNIVKKRKLLNKISQLPYIPYEKVEVLIKVRRSTASQLPHEVFCGLLGKTVSMTISPRDLANMYVNNKQEYFTFAEYPLYVNGNKYNNAFSGIQVNDIMQVKYEDKILYTAIWFDGC